MSLRILCVLLLACLTLLAVPTIPRGALAETAEEQATRQLEFARTEHEAGRHDRAIKSAQSALRFDPRLREAIIIKALAFEGLGEVQTAEALLAAYLDFSRGTPPDPRVAEATARLAAADKRKRRGQGAAPTIAELEGKTRELLTAGLCDEAFAAARDFVAAHAEEARGHAVLGDIHRCAVLPRLAALDYRKAVALGSRDGVVRARLSEIEAALATLVLEITAPSLQGLDVVLTLDTQALRPSLNRADARFELMPTGTALEVSFSGRGFVTETLAIAPLQPGEARRVPVTPTYLGLGTVSVSDWPGGSIDRVEILDGAEPKSVYPGLVLSLVAGTTTARITNATGTVEVPIQIVNAQETRFDPARWIPTVAVVTGLPTGATVEIKLGDRDAWVSREVPRGGGALNQTTGMLIAPPQTITGVLAGPSTLRVRHPSLGVGAQTITLAPATSSEVLFDITVLPESGALTRMWKARRPNLWRQPIRPPTIAALIGGGVGFVLASVFAGASADSAAKKVAKYELYFNAVGTGVDTDPLLEDWRAQDRTTEALRGLAGASLGVGAIGVGVAVPLHLFVRPKAKAVPDSEWAPEGF